MKIAMIGHKDFPSRSGGVEVVVYELATRLFKKGHQITVYNRGKKKGNNHFFHEGVEAYRVFTFEKQALNALVYSFTATVEMLFKKYDVVHYHALGPSVMILLAKLFRKKTVATVHGLDWQRAKWNKFATAYLKLGERIIAKYADEVIVLSDGVQKYFKEKYGRDTVFIKNAIVPVNNTEPEIIKDRFNLEKNSYILYLARIVPEKGLHYLIEAFGRCNTDKKLVIAGEVPDDEYGKKIKELSKNNGNIIFTGFVSGRILDELYSNCVLYVLPSEIEGLALTLLEAMSSGVRCLTSDIPENTDVTGEFGYSFKSSDAEDLKEVMQELLNSPDENPKYEAQIKYIADDYGYENVVNKTEGIYESVVNREKNGARREYAEVR